MISVWGIVILFVILIVIAMLFASMEAGRRRGHFGGMGPPVWYDGMGGWGSGRLDQSDGGSGAGPSGGGGASGSW